MRDSAFLVLLFLLLPQEASHQLQSLRSSENSCCHTSSEMMHEVNSVFKLLLLGLLSPQSLMDT